MSDIKEPSSRNSVETSSDKISPRDSPEGSLSANILLDDFILLAEKILNELIPSREGVCFGISYHGDVKNVISEMENKTLDNEFFKRFCKTLNMMYFKKEILKQAEWSDSDEEEGDSDEEDLDCSLSTLYIVASVKTALERMNIYTL